MITYSAIKYNFVLFYESRNECARKQGVGITFNRNEGRLLDFTLIYKEAINLLFCHKFNL